MNEKIYNYNDFVEECEKLATVDFYTIDKVLDLIEGWKIPHPTIHDAHQQNIVVNEILEAIKKLKDVRKVQNHE